MSKSSTTGDLVTQANATLEKFAEAALQVARARDWCSDWYRTFIRLSRAFGIEPDRRGFNGYKITVDASKLTDGTPGWLDIVLDLTEAGRAKIQERTTTAIAADLVSIRNRVAQLASDGNITVDEANLAITALGDAELYPLITQTSDGMYAYMPTVSFTPDDDNDRVVARRAHGVNLSTAFRAWLATNPEVPGMKNLTIPENATSEVYARDRRVTYGDREALLPR